MHVYTPPGYETGKDKYPVFYLLHGAGDSDDSWTSVGRAGFILDNLIAAKKAKPMIVVMPAGHTQPRCSGGRGGGRRIGQPTSSSRTSSTTSCRTSRRTTACSPTARTRDRRPLDGRQPDAEHRDPESREVRATSASTARACSARSRDAGAAAAAAPPPRPARTLGRDRTRRRSTTRPRKKGLKLLWFATGDGRRPDPDDEGDRGAAQEARLHAGDEGDARRPHLAQLARLPERVRAAAVPVAKVVLPLKRGEEEVAG